jgi:putative ABC transport system permease protein
MRLASVKGVPVDQILSNRANGTPDWPLKREYRSTWRSRLNDSERVQAGTFVGSVTETPDTLRKSRDDEPAYPVSLEEGIAKTLGVGLGDELVWDIQGVPMSTYVASLREVDWRQVRPNFFAVFPEGSLEAAPAMLVMATRVQDPQQAAQLQRALVTAFPNVSAIDLTLVLKTLDSVLTQVGFVIRFMALFTVFTGLIVLAGAVLTGRWQRVQESILLRTLGASRAQVRSILFAEYAALGFLASLSAVVLAVAGSWALARFVFEASYTVSAVPLLVAVVAVTALTVLVGLLTSRGIADQPPLEILRREA